MSVNVVDGPYVQPTRTATLDVYCTKPLTGPLQGSETTQRFSRGLSASDWSVSGDTITWRISSQLLRQAAVGRTLSNPRVSTWDGARVTETYNGQLGVAANGPGINDRAASSDSITLT